MTGSQDPSNGGNGGRRLAIRYHQQDQPTYCAAACQQMVLHTLYNDNWAYGPDPLTKLNQFDLQATNVSNTAAPFWGTDPEALTRTLNQYSSELGDKKSFSKFKVFTSSDPEYISRLMVWSIQKYGVPAVALIWGSLHWVVVSGFTTTDGCVPRTWDDSHYEIDKLVFNDPRPRRKQSVPHGTQVALHSERLDECGQGGQWGNKDQVIPYKTWLEDYFVGTVPRKESPKFEAYNRASRKWIGKYVAICACGADSSEEPDEPQMHLHRGTPENERLEAKRPGEGFDREIVRTLYRDGPQDAMWHMRLFSSGPRIPPLRVYTPLLVEFAGKSKVKHIPDKEKSFLDGLSQGDERDQSPPQPRNYYLYVIENSENGVSAAVRIDAHDLTYRESIGIYDDPYRLKTLVGSGDYITSGAQASLQNLLAAGSDRGSPRFTWKPCKESFSPFLVFSKHPQGYIRADGRVFPRLRDDTPGT